MTNLSWVVKIIKFPDLFLHVIVCLSVNIFWVSLLHFFHTFQLWHLILINKTLGLHHIVFLAKSHCNTSKYGTNTFTASTIRSWNFFRIKFSDNSLCPLPYSQLKVLVQNYFWNYYNQDVVQSQLFLYFKLILNLARNYFKVFSFLF